MKNQMLLALGLCYALMVNNSNAQPFFSRETAEAYDKGINYRDSFMLMPDESCKILFIGNHLEEMVNYTALDSTINLLIADVTKARMQPDYPGQSKLTYYIIHPNGKRRLKAENEDYAVPVNVADEARSLYLDLPPYVYVIYDLTNSYQIQIYLKNPDELTKLTNSNLKDALTAASLNKKTLIKNYRIDLTKLNEYWKVEKSYGNKLDAIEAGEALGVGLIGSKLCPALDFNFALVLSDKYRHPYFKTAIALCVYSYADWSKTEISNMGFLVSYDLKLMGNISVDKQRWFGVQGGMITSGYHTESPFNSRFKGGIVSEGIGVFNISLDFINVKKKEWIYGFTLKFPL